MFMGLCIHVLRFHDLCDPRFDESDPLPFKFRGARPVIAARARHRGPMPRIWPDAAGGEPKHQLSVRDLLVTGNTHNEEDATTVEPEAATTVEPSLCWEGLL